MNNHLSERDAALSNLAISAGTLIALHDYSEDEEEDIINIFNTQLRAALKEYKFAKNKK